MKRTVLLLIILAGITCQLKAQSLINVSAGYFGETGVYPGVVLELEHENYRSKQFSTTSSLDLGYYNHPRVHGAFFLDIHKGLRRTTSSGIMLESNLGLGVMFSYFNEEVYTMTEAGLFEETSRMANPDLMPSITLGLGYDFSNDRALRRMVWVRPKIFWQFPYNQLVLPHLSLQIGYTHTL